MLDYQFHMILTLLLLILVVQFTSLGRRALETPALILLAAATIQFLSAIKAFFHA